MKAELLARVPLFQAMPRRALDALAARAVRRSVRRGIGVRAGSSLVVLVTGRLELIAETVIRSLRPPAVVGLSVALGAPVTAELRAGEDSEVILVPADALAAALRRDPDAAVAAIAHLGRVIGELSAELEVLRRHGLVERVRHRLAQIGAGRREVAITHEQLAAEVGGTRANVSRALARLERDGVVERHRGRLRLR